MSTKYAHDFHNRMWIKEQLFLFKGHVKMSRKKKGRMVLGMEILSDELLVDSYNLAVQLNLDPEFIRLLFAEIRKREIEPLDHQLGA